MILYFAYGSNMDEKQMKQRCPGSKLICRAVLKDYKLAFSIYSPKRKCGCADIIKNKDSEVWGLVYNLNQNDLDKLDAFEMHPTKYKRLTCEVKDDLGNLLVVETYEVVDKSLKHLGPSRHYHDILVKASHKHNFPDSYNKFLSSVKLTK